MMRDFCDGEAFRKHPIFGSDPYAMQIELYYDDADVCNPIGSKATIHKLGKNFVYIFSVTWAPITPYVCMCNLC